MATPTKQQNDETQATVDTIIHGAPYRIAFEDLDFLAGDDLRPVRLQLEFLKPEWYLRQHKIRSTIVVFGSARILAPDVAREQLDTLLRAPRHGDAEWEQATQRARKQLAYSRYYEEARSFGERVSRQFQQEHRRDFVVITGGGPGIMEAANRGAHDIGARTIGLNITLPYEQVPNPYVSPELCFQFHYFALRKMHFLLRAKALVAFPGGFGTMDELFDALTLVQTRKMAAMPIILIGREFWSRAIDFDMLVEEGMIARRDRELFKIVDSTDEAVDILAEFYHHAPPPD
jgi:uncharacterized protein (TIGR00730 family)